MLITFQNYVDNPFGKANAVFTHRAMYKAMYSEKWDKLMLREAGKIEYHLYTDKAQDKYYIYIRIPSEAIKEFYYDVVVEFFTNEKAIKLARTLDAYDVRFFSNDPAFCYTYAHSFLKNDVFIKELAPRISNGFLQEKAVQRNPKNIVGYVKTLYFTYLFMKSRGLFSKIKYETSGEAMDFKKLISVIEHSDIKIAKRQELGEAKQKEKRDARAARIKEEHDKRREAILGKPKSNVKVISKIEPIKAISKIKKKTKKS